MTSSYTKHFLRLEWNKINHILGKNHGEMVFKIINDFYSEPHRHYHTLEHISSCLTKLNEYMNESKEERPWDLDAMRLAIWFHDIIYDTTEDNNEERSAKLAQALIYVSSQELASKVHNFILLTKHLNTAPEYKLLTEEKVFLDIDLSILGTDNNSFIRYDTQIREEYSWVPNDIYYQERLQIILKFLNKDSIFGTKYFQSNYETQAFHNLNYAREDIRKKLGYE